MPLSRASVLLDQSKKPHDLNVISSYLARFCELKRPVRRRRVLLLSPNGDERSHGRLTGELPACLPMGQVMGPNMPPCYQLR